MPGCSAVDVFAGIQRCPLHAISAGGARGERSVLDKRAATPRSDSDHGSNRCTKYSMPERILQATGSRWLHASDIVCRLRRAGRLSSVQWICAPSVTSYGQTRLCIIPLCVLLDRHRTYSDDDGKHMRSSWQVIRRADAGWCIGRIETEATTDS